MNMGQALQLQLMKKSMDQNPLKEVLNSLNKIAHILEKSNSPEGAEIITSLIEVVSKEQK